MDVNDIKFRVIKGNWRTSEVLFVSEPMDFGEAMLFEKPMVPELPPRGSGQCLLVKIHEDKGPDYPYMECGGWMIFTHREPVPW